MVKVTRCLASEMDIALAVEAAELADRVPYVCYICCAFRTYSINLLVRHSQQKHSRKLSVDKVMALVPGCPKCGKKYHRNSRLKAHVKACKHRYESVNDVDSSADLKLSKKDDCLKQSEFMRYQCYVCLRFYWSRSTLEKHLTRFHKRRPIQNKIICVAEDSAKGEDSAHDTNQPTPKLEKVETCQDAHVDLVYVCVVCKRGFSTTRAVGVHYRQRHPQDITRKQWFHLKNRSDALTAKTTCRICSKQFSGWKGMYQHQRVVHSQVSQKKSQQIFLAKHVERSKSCHTCNRKFASLQQLSQHKLSAHSKDMSRSASLCHLCGLTLASVSVTRHLKLAHRTTLNVIPIKPIPANKVKIGRYRCLYCKAEYPNASQLSQHMMRDHREILQTAESKPIPCPTCSLLFLNQMQLNHHSELVHTSNVMSLENPTSCSLDTELVFPCTKCGQVLSTLFSLEKHMRNLHLVKSIEGDVVEGVPRGTVCAPQPLCRVCDIQFERWALLYKHLRKQRCSKTTSNSSPTNWYCVQCMSPFQNEQRFLEHKNVCRGPKRRSELNLQAPQALLLDHYASACDSNAKSNMETHTHVDMKISDAVTHVRLDKEPTEHGQPAPTDGNVSKKRPTLLSCELCDMSYHSKSGLRKHLKTHKVVHVSPDVSESATFSQLPPVVHFSCEMCAFASKFRTNLRRHYISVHKLSKAETANRVQVLPKRDVPVSKSVVKTDGPGLPTPSHSQAHDSSSSSNSSLCKNFWCDTDWESTSSSSDTSSSDDSDDFHPKPLVSTNLTLSSSFCSSSSSDESGTDVELSVGEARFLSNGNSSSKDVSVTKVQSRFTESSVTKLSVDQNEVITGGVLELDEQIFCTATGNKRSFDTSELSINSDDTYKKRRFSSTSSSSSKPSEDFRPVAKGSSCFAASTNTRSNSPGTGSANSSVDPAISVKNLDSISNRRPSSSEVAPSSVLKETSQLSLPSYSSCNAPLMCTKSSCEKFDTTVIGGSMEKTAFDTHKKPKSSENYCMPVVTPMSSTYSDDATLQVTKPYAKEQIARPIVSAECNNSEGMLADLNPTPTQSKKPPVAILRPFSGVPENDDTSTAVSSPYAASSLAAASHSSSTLSLYGSVSKSRISATTPLCPPPCPPQIEASAPKLSYPIHCVNSSEYIVPLYCGDKSWYRKISVIATGESLAWFSSQWYKDFDKCTWKVVALLTKPLESHMELTALMKWILEFDVVNRALPQQMLQVGSFCNAGVESITIVTGYRTAKHSSICCFCGLLVRNLDELNAHGSTAHPVCSKCHLLKGLDSHLCIVSHKNGFDVPPKVKFIPLAQTSSFGCVPYIYSSADVSPSLENAGEQRKFQQRIQDFGCKLSSTDKIDSFNELDTFTDPSSITTGDLDNGINSTKEQSEAIDSGISWSLPEEGEQNRSPPLRKLRKLMKKDGCLEDTLPYRCIWCEIEFPLEIQLQHHLGTMHKKCTCCAEVFKDRQGRSDHITEKHQRYICLACDHTSEDVQNIQDHIMKDHVNKETGLFECIGCANKQITPEAIVDHLRKDDLDSSKKCHLCDCKLPSSSDSQLKHFCDHTFHSLKTYCIPCDKLFMEPWALRKHLLTATHGYCAKCLLSSRFTLGDHSCSGSGSEIHPTVTQAAAEKVGSLTAMFSRRCHLCSKDIHEMSLKQHCDEQHTQYRPQCQLCGQRFQFEHQRAYHMLVHRKKRTYVCFVCKSCLSVSSRIKQKKDKLDFVIVKSCQMCYSPSSGNDNLSAKCNIEACDKLILVVAQKPIDKPEVTERQNSSSLDAQNDEPALKVDVLVEEIESQKQDCEEVELMLDGRLYKFASDDEEDVTTPVQNETNDFKNNPASISRECPQSSDSDSEMLVIDETEGPRRSIALGRACSPLTVSQADVNQSRKVSPLSCHLCSYRCKLQVALNSHLAKKHQIFNIINTEGAPRMDPKCFFAS